MGQYPLDTEPLSIITQWLRSLMAIFFQIEVEVINDADAKIEYD